MKWMLDKLGNPEEKIQAVHVVGTNGKGSTVSYLREALVANNYKSVLSHRHLLSLSMKESVLMEHQSQMMNWLS